MSTTEDVCPVCQEGFSESESPTRTPCGHLYHFLCLMRSFESSNECCICRADLFPERVNRPRQDADVGVVDNEEDEDEDEDGVVEISLDDLGDETIEQIRSHIREQLSVQLGQGVPGLTRVSRTDELFSACKSGDLTRVSSLLNTNPDLKYSKDMFMNTILHFGVLSENESLVRYLLNEQLVPIDCFNIHRQTAIHYAVMAKSIRMVRLLINCGGYVDSQDNAGQTPLMLACKRGDGNICQILLDNDSSVTSFDLSGQTPLHIASSGRSNSCIRNIMANDSTNENATDFFGNTPLHLACLNGSVSIVRILLSGCADPELKNKAGHKPLDLISSENSRLRSLVRDHSA